jgi:hypothetical protein
MILLALSACYLFAVFTKQHAWALVFALMSFAFGVSGCSGPGDPHSRMCMVAFSEEHAAITVEAADEWRDRTGGRAALRLEAAPREEDCSDDAIPMIMVKDLRGADGEAALGATSGRYSWIQFEADPKWLPIFSTTALHEFGHFLTDADGHSADPRDIMFPHWNDQQDGHLTARDVTRFED